MKKSESDSESEEKQIWIGIRCLEERIMELEKHVRALIGEVEAMQRGDNTGAKHQNDGGYFD